MKLEKRQFSKLKKGIAKVFKGLSNRLKKLRGNGRKNDPVPTPQLSKDQENDTAPHGNEDDSTGGSVPLTEELDNGSSAPPSQELDNGGSVSPPQVLNNGGSASPPQELNHGSNASPPQVLDNGNSASPPQELEGSGIAATGNSQVIGVPEDSFVSEVQQPLAISSSNERPSVPNSARDDSTPVSINGGGNPPAVFSDRTGQDSVRSLAGPAGSGMNEVTVGIIVASILCLFIAILAFICLRKIKKKREFARSSMLTTNSMKVAKKAPSPTPILPVSMSSNSISPSPSSFAPVEGLPQITVTPASIRDSELSESYRNSSNSYFSAFSDEQSVFSPQDDTAVKKGVRISEISEGAMTDRTSVYTEMTDFIIIE
ncbi:MAG: hypothetical protein SGCHY_003521 [Lobulomycetales sp.]